MVSNIRGTASEELRGETGYQRRRVYRLYDPGIIYVWSAFKRFAGIYKGFHAGEGAGPKRLMRERSGTRRS